MNLLAKSCFSPGLITLISNLISSCGVQSKGMKEDWLKEYAEGMDCEMYRIKISDFYYQNDDIKGKYLTFDKIVEIVYQEYTSVVFALEIESK